jgi:predicted SAM-dependent methyltransferase
MGSLWSRLLGSRKRAASRNAGGIPPGLTPPFMLHLGSGPYRFDGWVNLDLDSPAADIRMDLRDSLPFPDASVRFLYAEHFIEHITRDEACRLLGECARVLVRDGVIRLSTPDLAWLAEVYMRHETHHWKVLWQPKTPCQMLNEGMRSWGHQFLYDRAELIDVLAEAGFSVVREVAWRESTIPELRGREQRPFHREIIVEAARSSEHFP